MFRFIIAIFHLFLPRPYRTFELIGSAGKDGSIRIWRVQRQSGDKAKYTVSTENGSSGFKEDRNPVWRVQWNNTGTVLASSGNDGTVRLWKANFFGKWACLSVISGKDVMGDISSDA